ncbi:acetyl/propionyl/methylcrotonyl-CoA carboxylase subunit alpha [Sandaracinobacteroides saxicola]|uniref:Methylcrotonoyl-CoA carboxylase n=1 Tax=Sandaracinobacteroides saxicola TaxID=2759707 RepID=A0A7G5IKW9_9SPHN|nr:biotin carboxylase N-terminal domain-containing protein [Sandaracinobacteroides saxicola]QMW24011.1 methylcrotonoyl-CoA carboxylase [Sandaracinobacteroides saxicola]
MHKLLIANRGEIACRIIRTARAMGIATVAVHSDADGTAPHVRLADEAIAIGPAPARDSYLVAEKIIAAARATGADAIHPGYGFLSENADFADAVRGAGLIFVGPSGEAIRVMGLKDTAKAKMKGAGVPITPGYQGADQSLPRLERAAAMVGYPLLIKAVAGGGGKGMRAVQGKAEFTEALLSAKREAQASFGNDHVLLEKLITRPRHVEVQIFGDRHGNVVHLFERDCSLQRRHQKVLEEAPAPGLSDRLRETLGIAAVTAGMAIAYEGAGTIEFILDCDDLDEAGDPKFYFMEMNTRLQVEHPVTELITGQDLVEWQLRIARGEMLPLSQTGLEASDHAVEARLYAENPDTGFLPAIGKLQTLRFPTGPGIRIDAGVEEGGEVTPFYDPMIAKVIGHGPTRAAAIDNLVAALDATIVEGVTTNRGFLARLADHADFRAGDIDTGFIGRHLDGLLARPEPDERLVAIAAALLAAETSPGAGPFARHAGFRLNLPRRAFADLFTVDGGRIHTIAETTGEGWTIHGQTTAHHVIIRARAGNRVDALVDGQPLGAIVLLHPGHIEIRLAGVTHRFNRTAPRKAAAGPADGCILAPMPGRVLSLHVAAGDRVQAGDRLLVLEAMKMEHRLTAPFDGTVAALTASVNAQVSEGTLLITIEKAA